MLIRICVLLFIVYMCVEAHMLYILLCRLCTQKIARVTTDSECRASTAASVDPPLLFNTNTHTHGIIAEEEALALHNTVNDARERPLPSVARTPKILTGAAVFV